MSCKRNICKPLGVNNGVDFILPNHLKSRNDNHVMSRHDKGERAVPVIHQGLTHIVRNLEFLQSIAIAWIDMNCHGLSRCIPIDYRGDIINVIRIRSRAARQLVFRYNVCIDEHIRRWHSKSISRAVRSVRTQSCRYLLICRQISHAQRIQISVTILDS